MAEYSIHPLSKVPEEIIKKAENEIESHTVSLIFSQDSTQNFGSGTFVNWNNIYGILTAYHVIKGIFLRKGGKVELGLNISERSHRFTLQPDFWEHVIIGEYDVESKLGPDLSFVQILDPIIISRIKASRKTFYPLHKRIFLDNQDLSYKNLLWFLAGANQELTKNFNEIGTLQNPLDVQHLIAQIEFQSKIMTDRFDFIDFSVPVQKNKYPSTYKGASGGGIWLVPLCFDPDKGFSTLTYEAPVLSGVAFYEEEQEDSMTITCHGPNSIYSTTIEKIKEISRSIK